MKKLNYKAIKEKLKNEYEVELLSKTYKNCRQKLIYMDKDGYMYYSSWENISQGKRCSLADKRNIFAIRNIKNYIKVNNISTELVSEKYEKELVFKCKCGIIFKRSWDKFNQISQVCCKCALKARGLNHRNDIKPMYDLFLNKGYTLNGDIHHSTEKIDCFDKNGYRGMLSYHRLSQGDTFDRFSFKNPYLKYNIEHFMCQNDCTAKLLSIQKRNKFSNSFLHLKCNCGNTYKTIWSTFAYYQVFRCPICSKKQSKYASLTEEYLKSKHINYQKEYSFDDCKSISKLFFDFALFINGAFILVEVDGQYHFKDYYGDLQSQLERDEIKNRYCKEHNIPLIRIPYWEYKKDNYKHILNKEIYKYIIENT